MSETLVIPAGSRERFLRFRNAGDSDGWFANGVELAGLSDLKPGYRVRRPSCGHHFLGCLTAGTADFEISGSLRSVAAGEVVFLPGGTLHHFGSRRRFSMIWLHLDAAHPRWKTLAGRGPILRRSRCLASAADLMERAFAEAQSPLWRTGGVAEPLCRLILAYADRELHTDRAGHGGPERVRLERVWHEVGSDLGRAWNVAGLARLAGLSPSHFHASVAAAYRKTPMQIVRDLRIERARVLLIQSDHKLEAISALVGYESAFSFSKTFKAVVGVPPREYRDARRTGKTRLR